MTLIPLSQPEISPLLFGVFRAEEESEGIFPNRMTPALRAFYTYSDAALIRARCTSGARLRFQTDSPRFLLRLRTGRQARARHCADLILDGVFTQSFRSPAQPGAILEVAFEQTDPRPRLVEIWLPHVTECWIASLEIESNATLTPTAPPHPALWLAIGDSITQGMEASSPALTWTSLAARSLGVGLLNTGVGGAKMDPQAGHIKEIPAAVISVAFGTNDWNISKPSSQFESDARRLLDRLQSLHPRTPLLLLTPLPALRKGGERNQAGVELERFRETLRTIAAERNNLTLVEGTSLVPPDPVAFSDGIHPNDAGMAVFARKIQPFLARSLGLQPPLPLR